MNFFENILNLSRNAKIIIVYFLDCILLISSLYISFFIISNFTNYIFENFLTILILCFLISNFVFIGNGLYKNIFRYSGFSIVLKITISITIYFFLCFFLSFLLFDIINIQQIIIIQSLIYFQSILLSRYLMSSIYKSIFKIKNKNILICGLGSELYDVVNYFDQYLDYKICGIISADKNSARINNIKIFDTSKIQNLIKIKNIDEIYVSELYDKSNLNKLFDLLNIKIKKLPNLKDISSSTKPIGLINNINIEDLLERPKVKDEKSKIFRELYNSTVLVTGGGGSIGSELSTKLLYQHPKEIIIIENSELNLFEIQKKLDSLISSTNINIHYYLNDIKDLDFLNKIFNKYEINFVFHCAAYKHVHLSEENTITFLENNVIPTYNLSNLSIKYKINKFVFISTDKAVRPTNVMGASKRVAELCIQYFASKTDHNTIFSIVRFGNVLNSSGSVVPIFKEQINNGGPLTVTDKKVVRYFMLIDEAVLLILNAFEIAKGGEVFVLNMSKQINIYELAKKMIKLSDLKEINEVSGEGDIKINITGLRKGEKMFEELFIDENFDLKSNKKLFISKDSYLRDDNFKSLYEELNKYIIDKNEDKAIELLKNNIENYKDNYEPK